MRIRTLATAADAPGAAVAPGKRGAWRDAAALAILYALAASASIVASHQPGSIAAIWFANAVAVGFMLTAPSRHWAALLAATAVGNLSANLWHGSPTAISLALLAGNLVEVLLAALLLRRAGLDSAGLRSVRAMLQLIVLGALVPQAVGATLGAAALQLHGGGPFGAIWQTWYEGSAIGSISVLALVVGLRQEQWARVRDEMLDWRFFALGMGAAGVALLSLANVPFPFVYIAIPLMLAASLLGMNAALMLVLFVSIVVTLALGTGVFAPPPITARWEEVFVYSAYAAALVPAQLLAAAVAGMRDGQERLAQTTAELQRANDGLEQFVRIASHDMREPLNTIVQFSSLIEQDHGELLPVEARRWLGLVVGAGTRMRRLLDDVLNYVRMQRVGDVPDEPVDLNRILHEVLASLAGRVSDTGADVSVGSLPVVCGHESALSLLFQNLLSNALKFMPAGRSPVIRVVARQEEGVALIEVADNGIGIDEQDFPKLFKPFQRLHLRRHYEGTGLGLALVRQIAEAHGGSVSLASEPGSGTRVTVQLPLNEPSAQALRTNGAQGA